MAIVLLKETNLPTIRHRLVQQSLCAGREGPLHIFKEGGGEKEAERFQRVARFDRYLVFLAGIEDQVGSIVHSMASATDAIVRPPAGETLNREFPGSFPMISTRELVQYPATRW